MKKNHIFLLFLSKMYRMGTADSYRWGICFWGYMCEIGNPNLPSPVEVGKQFEKDVHELINKDRCKCWFIRIDDIDKCSMCNKQIDTFERAKERLRTTNMS